MAIEVSYGTDVISDPIDHEAAQYRWWAPETLLVWYGAVWLGVV